MGKSLARPPNSVSLFVNRRVSKASEVTHFLLPCAHIHDAPGARNTLILWMSFSSVPHKRCHDPGVGYKLHLERDGEKETRAFPDFAWVNPQGPGF